MTVIEFIKARLAEDEAIAQAAVYVEQGWRVETVSDKVRVTSGGEFTEDVDGDYYFGAHPVADRFDVPISRHQLVHVAHHDPARVLREVAAKRTALAALKEVYEFDLGWEYTDAPDLAVAVLSAMANAYSNHPDFDSEWA